MGEASTSVLHTIGEETDQDKETQVRPAPGHPSTQRPSSRASRKSFLYRKLNYCYDNFYKVFFGKDKAEFGDDFETETDISDDEDYSKVTKYDDDGVYEDVDTSLWLGRGLDVIQEESDSDYYRSVDYCNMMMNKRKEIEKESVSGSDFDRIVENCEGYLEDKEKPALQPRNNASDKIYNFKKDFSNHDYVNLNFDNKLHDYENVNFDRRTKNDLLREKFFLSEEKNAINEKLNGLKDKKIECQSIRSDVTKTGPDVKVSGALNMKLLNLDKYNRILTTTETFMESAEASFTKSELHKRKDDLESFVKRSEKYYTSESRDRKTTVTLDGKTPAPKGKTEVRIFYNPTFRSTGKRFIKGFCLYCKRRCPRTEEKCCEKCVCLETELKLIWKENWLNILCFLGLVFMFFALLVQCFVPSDVCEGGNGSVVNGNDSSCFQFV